MVLLPALINPIHPDRLNLTADVRDRPIVPRGGDADAGVLMWDIHRCVHVVRSVVCDCFQIIAVPIVRKREFEIPVCQLGLQVSECVRLTLVDCWTVLSNTPTVNVTDKRDRPASGVLRRIVIIGVCGSCLARSGEPNNNCATLLADRSTVFA